VTRIEFVLSDTAAGGDARAAQISRT